MKEIILSTLVVLIMTGAVFMSIRIIADTAYWLATLISKWFGE